MPPPARFNFGNAAGADHQGGKKDTAGSSNKGDDKGNGKGTAPNSPKGGTKEDSAAEAEARTAEEERQREQKAAVIVAQVQKLNRGCALLKKFVHRVGSIHTNCLDREADMVKLLNRQLFGIFPKAHLGEMSIEPFQSLVDRLGPESPTHKRDATVAALQSAVLFKFATEIDKARYQLAAYGATAYSTVQKLAHLPYGEDEDQIRQVINVEMYKTEAAVSSDLNEVAQCVSDNFYKVHRILKALRDTFDRLRSDARESCDRSLFEEMDNQQERTAKWEIIFDNLMPLFSNQTCDTIIEEPYREKWRNIERAMTFVMSEKEGAWAQTVYEEVDIELRQMLREEFSRRILANPED